MGKKEVVYLDNRVSIQNTGVSSNTRYHLLLKLLIQQQVTSTSVQIKED